MIKHGIINYICNVFLKVGEKMDFKEWLKTATKRDGSLLSARTVDHYFDGFKIISEEMLSANVITKRLEDMELFELDLAIALIFKNPQFLAKDKKGNKMYSNSLKRYRCYKFLNTELGIQEFAKEAIVNNDDKLSPTEKEIIVKARRGQGLYREQLMKKYNRTCIMTKVSLSQVLVASHIKPWVVCSNKERIDVNNGLLLSATYDRLFDSGLITFNFEGKLKISSLVSQDNAEKLGIINGTVYEIKYNPNMMDYIKYHNEYIFVN